MPITNVDSIPDSYDEMISAYIAISPNIAEYYVGEQFKLLVRECKTIATPQFICNNLTSQITAELEEMGISFEENLDMIYENLHTTSLLLVLRRLFDVRLFCTFYNRTSEEVRYHIVAILENANPDDMAIEIVEFLHSRFPSNDNLEFIIDRKDLFISTDEFRPYLKELINLTESKLDNAETIEECLITPITEFTTYLNTHKANVVFAVKSIIREEEDLNIKFLTDELTRYDNDLLATDYFNFLSIVYDKNRILELYQTDIFKKHLKRSNHHLDFYKDTTPTKSELVLIVSELFAMAIDFKKPTSTFIEMISKKMIFDSSINIEIKRLITLIPVGDNYGSETTT